MLALTFLSTLAFASEYCTKGSNTNAIPRLYPGRHKCRHARQRSQGSP